MSIDPEQARRSSCHGAGDAADGHGVITAERERDRATLYRLEHTLAQEPAHLGDGWYDVLPRQVGGLRRLDVAEVRHRQAELTDPGHQAGITQRRWAHVGAAHGLAEIERRAHDVDRRRRR